MTNKSHGDEMIEALDNIIKKDFVAEPRPDIEPIAIRMRDDHQFRISILGFLTMLCTDCPSVLEGLLITSVLLKSTRITYLKEFDNNEIKH